MDRLIHNFILEKMRFLATPAGGCTEIGAIGYCVAYAAKFCSGNILKIKKLTCSVSPYIYKNVMRVGVPNFSTCGIDMIVSASCIIANPDKKLEIFSIVTQKQKLLAEKLIKLNKIHVDINEHADPVYVKTTIIDEKNNQIESLIEKDHVNLIYVKLNGKDVIKTHSIKCVTLGPKKEIHTADDFSIKDLIKIVGDFSINELDFLYDLFKLNQNISEYGKKKIIKNSYTYCLLKTLPKNKSIEDLIILDTAAAIDARMSGAPLPVMTSYGSGDHGLTVSIPQFTYHKAQKTSKLVFLQALLLANLLVWKIKSNIGNLSCFCGSVIAAVTATVAALAYQKKFSIQSICDLIESMLCSFNSIMCDGAKLSCTHKVISALISGLHLINLTSCGYKIQPLNGIIYGDVDKTLTIYRRLSKENSSSYNRSIVNAMINMKK